SGCADHFSGALDITPGHRQGTMSEKIANDKGAAAGKSGKGAGGVAQIVNSGIGDAGAISQPAPGLLCAVVGERLCRTEPLDQVPISLFDYVEDRQRRGAKMYRPGAAFGISQSNCAAREVDIGPNDPKRLSQPHPSRGKQPDEQNEAGRLRAGLL